MEYSVCWLALNTYHKKCYPTYPWIKNIILCKCFILELKYHSYCLHSRCIFISSNNVPLYLVLHCCHVCAIICVTQCFLWRRQQQQRQPFHNPKELRQPSLEYTYYNFSSLRCFGMASRDHINWLRWSHVSWWYFKTVSTNQCSKPAWLPTCLGNQIINTNSTLFYCFLS